MKLCKSACVTRRLTKHMADGIIDLTITDQVGVCATMVRLFEFCYAFMKFFYWEILISITLTAMA